VAQVLPLQRLAKLPRQAAAQHPAPAPAAAASAPDEWLAVAQQQFPAARWSP
jgi:hypothetical protein